MVTRWARDGVVVELDPHLHEFSVTIRGFLVGCFSDAEASTILDLLAEALGRRGNLVAIRELYGELR